MSAVWQCGNKHAAIEHLQVALVNWIINQCKRMLNIVFMPTLICFQGFSQDSSHFSVINGMIMSVYYFLFSFVNAFNCLY
jgi:hypothetical protein